MSFKIGDLVKCKSQEQRLGLVVDKKMPNEGLDISAHVKHLMGVYKKVYYVYFSGLGRRGPFHETDLVLAQSCQTTTSMDV
jgi:hypothetical protein